MKRWKTTYDTSKRNEINIPVDREGYYIVRLIGEGFRRTKLLKTITKKYNNIKYIYVRIRKPKNYNGMLQIEVERYI
jgi:hypothetical protein